MRSGTVRVGKVRDERDEGCAERVVHGTTVWPQRLAGHVLAGAATLLYAVALSTHDWLDSEQQLNATHTHVIHSGISYECQFWRGVLSVSGL